MGTFKIKFLREGKGKIGLKRQSYPFRRISQKGHFLFDQNGRLGRAGFFQSVLFISSMLNLFTIKDNTDYKIHLNTSLLMKLKDSSLEFSVETGNNSDEFLTKIIGNHNSSETQFHEIVKGKNF